MEAILENPYLGVVFFAVYSCMGWILETVYRSMQQRRFVNAGFLFGPFVPLYGFGALFVLAIDSLLVGWPLVWKLIPYAVMATVLEYLVGYLFERLFGLTLWDYSNNRFNIHGRVCLLYSVLWSILALVFTTIIHPLTSMVIAQIDPALFRPAATVFVTYLSIDFAFSVMSLASFRKSLESLYDKYLILTPGERESLFKSFRRSIRAFPNLGRYIDRSINHDIKTRLGNAMRTIREKLRDRIEGRKPYEREFNLIVRDILRHPEFLRLKEFYHHNSSIYEHAKAVSYLSYRISKILGLDYRSAARGAMLHDFFLYDWRNHDEPDLPKDTFHGPAHPKIALSNAEKHFTLNDIERDIIVKHMWPLTPVPPRYRESFIVTFADKYLSSKEFIDESRKRRRHKKRRTAKPVRKRTSRLRAFTRAKKRASS